MEHVRDQKTNKMATVRGAPYTQNDLLLGIVLGAGSVTLTYYLFTKK